jgi:dephospho-CoA kinase
MANRIIAIGGEPASGKSTLMKKIIKDFLPLKTFQYGLVRGLYCKDRNLFFIGIYDDSVFCGTDKLSMAVQPHFIKLINKIKDGTFVFEGDRLFNQSLFDQTKCDIYVLRATQKTLEQRHESRNDNQTDKFKKAKKTKVENIIHKNSATLLPNNTKAESENCHNVLIKAINGK